MKTVRRAVIDIGTNSIKLLVADVTGHEVQPIWEGSKQTRLGQGFYDTHQLQPAAISQTALAVREFASIAREHQARSVRVIATSAVRDAINPSALTSRIRKEAGLKVEILSGEEEADLVYEGVITAPGMATAPLLLLDVGGGSTEFILGTGLHKHFQGSFPLGSVRLMEHSPQADPPLPEELTRCQQWVRRFLKTEVQPDLEAAISQTIKKPRHPVQLVGVGGSASILARIEAKLESYNRARIEATRLSLERLRWHVKRLWGLRLEQRKEIVGLPANRADVILMGAVIYEQVMDVFGFAELQISTRGLRFAAVKRGTATRLFKRDPLLLS